MWILHGAFDGPMKNTAPPTKAKLLKTGTSYALGRDGEPLLLNWTTMSKKGHGEFTVGKCNLDNVVRVFTFMKAIRMQAVRKADPGFRPTLVYTNKRDKTIAVERADERLIVNPASTFELKDGDVVNVLKVTSIRVEWNEVCCYSPASHGASSVSLASLGVHMVHEQSQAVTHHLTENCAATTPHALSLVLASTLVKPGWLNELVRLGDLPHNCDPSSGVSLEQAFALPSPTKFRPTFHSSLPSTQKTFKVWDANEERLTMFAQYRFHCLAEGSKIQEELRNLLSWAGGRVDVLSVNDGLTKWRKSLIRGKAKVDKTLVVVADQAACTAAVGEELWAQLANEADIFKVRVVSPQDIMQAVINTDTSAFDPPPADDAAPPSSPLPDVVPSTLMGEESLEPEPEEPEPEPEKPPPRKLPRRASSRQASQEPKAVEDEAPPAPRRLTRRAQAVTPMITGIDDASILLNNLPVSMGPPAPIDPTKPRSRLKRRAGVAIPNPADVSITDEPASGVEPETGEEPPLKKFKALFEESDPKRSGAETFVQESGAFDEDELMLMASIGSQTQTQTQTETQTQTGGKRSMRSGGANALRAVQEEEEESQLPADGSGANDAGKKRKERSFDRDDADMAGVEEALNAASGSSSEKGPAAKRQALPSNAVERAASKPPSAVAGPSKITKPAGPALTKPAVPTKTTGKKGPVTGAPTGKPDTDSVFLKAIASTKRGKKTEDEFDRDFNKLKISKPDLMADEGERRPEWELLETFGDETNLRGNFMVIQDLDVFKAAGGQGPRKRAAGTDTRWEGKPDFKKFKKQNSNAVRKKLIELVISEENDSGIGPGYWKGADSPSRSEDNFGPSEKRPTLAKRTQAKSKGKTQTMIIDDSDEDEAEVIPKRKSKASLPPSKPAPKKRATHGGSKVPDTPAALFLDDSDEDIDSRNDDAFEGATLDENDSDGGMTLDSNLGGTSAPARRSSRAPATRKKAAPIIVDDDSDDGAVFKGFGKKKR